MQHVTSEVWRATDDAHTVSLSWGNRVSILLAPSNSPSPQVKWSISNCPTGKNITDTTLNERALLSEHKWMHDTDTLNTFPAGFQTTASPLPQLKHIPFAPSLKSQSTELTQLDNLRIRCACRVVPSCNPSTQQVEAGGLRA